MNLDPTPYTIYKNNTKWIIDLNARNKAIKLLEEKNLHDLRLGNGFLNSKPKL